MRRRSENQKVMSERDGETSMEPILQDFSITSQSDIRTDVLPPSDSSLFEKIINYDVALPNMTLNETDDVNLSSGLYPPDTTIMDILKFNSPSKPSFKKPFNIRRIRKPRPSLFDNDIQDSENDTPTQKIRKPFKRTDKNAINSDVFADVFNSSNESTAHSKINTNFITRRKRREKKNVNNSLFDKDLNSSESAASFSECRTFPKRKKIIKKLNSVEFDQVFDDTLDGSHSGEGTSKKMPFNFLKNRADNVNSSLFDNDLNSSESFHVSSRLGTNDKEKGESVNLNEENNHVFDNPLNESDIDKAVSFKRPLKILKNRVNNIESGLFDSDLNSSDSFHVSGRLGSNDNHSLNESHTDKAVSKKRPLNRLKDRVNNVESGLFDSDLNSSDSVHVSCRLEICDNEKSESVDISNIKNKNVSLTNLSDSRDKDSSNISQSKKMPFKSLLSKQNSIESNLFDSALNSSSSLQLSSGINSCDEKGNSLSESRNITLHNERKDITKDISHTLINEGNSLSGSISNNLIKYDKENTSSHNLIDAEEHQHNEENCSSDNNNKNNTNHKSFHSSVEVELCVKESSKSKTVTDNPLLSQKNECMKGGSYSQYNEHLKETLINKSLHNSPLLTNESINTPNNSESDILLEEQHNPLEVSSNKSGVKISVLTEGNKQLMKKYDDIQGNSMISTEEPNLCLEEEQVDEENEYTYRLEESECRNHLSEIHTLLPNENQKEMGPSSNIHSIEFANVDSLDITSPFQEENLLEKNNSSKNILELPTHQSLLMQKNFVKTCETVTISERQENPSPEIATTSKARDERNVLNYSNIYRDDLIPTSLNDINRLSTRIPDKPGKISYEAADSSNPTFKKRRVSFLCDVQDVNKSMRRRSIRKSIIRNSTEQQSTSKINGSQLSRSEFSLFIEPSSNSVSSDSVYIDIHPSRSKSTSSSVSGNSLHSSKPSTSISSSECCDSAKNTTNGYLRNSLINKSQQAAGEDKLLGSMNKNLEGKETTEVNSANIDLTEADSKEDSEEEAQVENDETSHTLTDEEMKNGTEEESEQEKETTEVNSANIDVTEADSKEDSEEEAQVENDKTSHTLTDEEMKDGTEEESENVLDEDYEDIMPNKTGFTSKEYSSLSEKEMQQTPKQKSGNTKENCSNILGVSNTIQQECNFSFKVPNKPKRVSRKRTSFKKPFPKPLNKSKVQEILNQLPYSELKRTKKKCLNARKLVEQNILDKEPIVHNVANRKESGQKNTGIVSRRLFKPRKWLNSHIHKFISKKLEPRFGISSRVKAEKVVISLFEYAKQIMAKNDHFYEIVEKMKRELAEFGIIQSHMDFRDLASSYFDGDFQDKLYPYDADSEWNPFEPDDLLETIL